MTLFLIVAAILLLLAARPCGYVALEQLPRVLTQTLDNYVGRGRSSAPINETTERTLGLTGRILAKTKEANDSGLQIRTKLQFNKSEVAQWVAVGQKLDLAGTKPPSWTTIPRRFLRLAQFIEYAEIDTQGNEIDVVNDLVKQAKEDVDLSVCNLLHDAFNAVDGNYLHDGTSSNLAMFGWRQYLTLDGLHITGDTSKSIAGVNPSTQPLWKNPYISPVGASDGRAAIKSVWDLRKALARALTMLSFQGVSSFGALAKNVRAGAVPDETNDDQDRLTADDWIICTDSGTFQDYREVVFDKQMIDGRDQGLLSPVYKGVAVLENERMGLSSTYGYGYDSSGTALWTDRGGSYASGNWKGYGETVVIQRKYLKFYVHSDHYPHIYPSYKPEGMAGVAYEADVWCQLAPTSRRRLGVYIGPYALTG